MGINWFTGYPVTGKW